MFLTVFLSLFISLAQAETVKVAVLDTGVGRNHDFKLCKEGNQTFVQQSYIDTHGHGTNVSYLINKGLGKSDYCQVILKIYDPGKDSMEPVIKALRYVAGRDDIKIVHMSLAGLGYNLEERNLLRLMIEQGKKIVVASGNQRKNLDKDCIYYPVCYNLTLKEIVTVGNGINGKPQDGSNFGSVVDLYIDGHAKGPRGLEMSGSSQSAAIYTNRLIKMMVNKNDER